MSFESDCVQSLTEQFQYLFEAELIQEICRTGKRSVFEEGQILIDIGDFITNMPLVISGSVKIMVEDKEGNELLLYYLELGDTCAVTLNCCTRKTKSTIRAITESKTELLFIPVEMMENWMVKFQSWRNYVLESYNSRLNEMVDAIDNLVFNSMEERLNKYLYDRAWVTKSDVLNISHADIANDLHSSRVVISRLMKKLEKKGVIEQNRNKIRFLEFSKP